LLYGRESRLLATEYLDFLLERNKLSFADAGAMSPHVIYLFAMTLDAILSGSLAEPLHKNTRLHT
jgi:hypothetical protein